MGSPRSSSDSIDSVDRSSKSPKNQRSVDWARRSRSPPKNRRGYTEFDEEVVDKIISDVASEPEGEQKTSATLRHLRDSRRVSTIIEQWEIGRHGNALEHMKGKVGQNDAVRIKVPKENDRSLASLSFSPDHRSSSIDNTETDSSSFFMHILVEEASGLCNVNSASSGTNNFLHAGQKGKSTNVCCKLHIEKAGVKFKTKEADRTLNPVWNQIFTAKLSSPAHLSASIDVKLISKSKILDHLVIGKASIDIKEIVESYRGVYYDWLSLFDDSSCSFFSSGRIRLKIVIDFHPDLLQYDENSSEIRCRARKLLYAPMDILPASKLRIFMISWNAGNAMPPDDLFSIGFTHRPESSPFHMYVIGLQESDVPSVSSSQNISLWENFFRNQLGNGFVALKPACLWQIRLWVFVRRELSYNVSGIHLCDEATGIGNVLGNKGATAVALTYKTCQLCFVNSHLAAHQGNVQERNSQVFEIMKGMRLNDSSKEIVSQFHHIFWIGDLNYRLNVSVSDQSDDSVRKTPSEETFNWIVDQVDKSHFSALFAFDQLSNEIKEGRVFYGFSEGNYLFPPTFKLIQGETLVYNPKRAPAWCDRMLWSSAPGFEDLVDQKSINSSIVVTTSDHKPIYSTIVLLIPSLPSPWVLETDQEDAPDAFYIQIRQLRASQLKRPNLRHLSARTHFDPFVTFSGDILLEKASSSVVPKELNPEWPDFDIEPIPLRTNNWDRLQHELMVVQVRGADRLKIRKRCVFGTGRICLKHFSEPNEWFEVQVPLLKGGLLAGTLYVNAKVTTNVDAIEPKLLSDHGTDITLTDINDEDALEPLELGDEKDAVIADLLERIEIYENRIKELEDTVEMYSERIKELEETSVKDSVLR